MVRPIQLIIAGAEKGGTTSLSYYLAQHPEICTHDQLEMMYFTNEVMYAKGYENAYDYYFSYCQPKKQQVIQAKNVGIMYLLHSMQRLKKHNPDVQIVLSLRNPIDRAYSAYWYARRYGLENLPSFEAAIEADPSRFKDDTVRQRACAYLDRSKYSKHLIRLFSVFSREQLHIYLFKEILQNSTQVCQEIYQQFSVLDPTFIPNVQIRKNIAAKARNQNLTRLFSSTHPIPSFIRTNTRRILPERIRRRIRTASEIEIIPPTMSLDTRNKLIDYFHPHNTELSKLLGRDLSYWERL